MAVGSYISIISINVNKPIAPTKLAELIQKQGSYKRPTSNLGTHTDWKWGMENSIPWKWKYWGWQYSYEIK